VNRPTAVTVIGWIYIAVAILMILSSVMSFAVSATMPPPPSPDRFPSDGSTRFGFWLFGHLRVVAVIQIVAALVTLAASVAFLRLQSWGRVVLELLAWLALTYDLVCGGFWLYSAASMTSRMPSSIPPFPSGLFLGTGVVIIAVFAVPIVVIIRFLRGNAIRDAVGAGETTGST
jgi:hypothetical protein